MLKFTALVRYSILAFCLAFGLGLSGCADGPGSPYLNASQMNDVGTILTPEQRKKAVEELEKEQRSTAQGASGGGDPNKN
jgi:hypothetical protein